MPPMSIHHYLFAGGVLFLALLLLAEATASLVIAWKEWRAARTKESLQEARTRIWNENRHERRAP